MKNIVFSTRSLFYDIKNDELVELPVIEFVSNIKNYIKSMILEHVDPDHQHDDYNISMIRQGIKEDVNFDDINLEQAIHIAQHVGVDHNEILINPDHFTFVGCDGQSYMFNNAIFNNCSEKILHSLAMVVVEAFQLDTTDVVHLILPDWLECSLAGCVLEICYDPVFGPNLAVIDKDHPRREEIDNNYVT